MSNHRTKRPTRSGFCFCLRMLALVGLCALNLSAAETKPPRVVVISIDGFPASLWRRADLPAPHLRRLAADGAAADAMTVANPSVTWPNHTTLVTGVSPRRHGLLYNGLLVHNGPHLPPTVTPQADKTALVDVPTVYDVAHAAGLTTAESNWVAVRNAPTITWSFPEFPKTTDPVVAEMMKAGVLTEDEVKGMEYGQPTNLPWHDGLWLRGASFIVEHHRPNLLLYHILTTDSTHHTFGPGNVASFAALAFADRLVGEFLQTLERNGLRDETTLIITSDHGFKKVSKLALPNVALRKAGLLQTAGARVVSCDAYVKGGGGVGLAYITDRARLKELKPVVRKLLEGSEGIAEVIDGDDGPSMGMPSPAEKDKMGDFILYPKAGYAIRDQATGDDEAIPATNYAGTHGGRADDPDLDAIFIASGRGIKHGIRLPRMRNLDVAPTIAKLLGVTLPDVEGRVLDEILEDAPHGQ